MATVLSHRRYPFLRDPIAAKAVKSLGRQVQALLFGFRLAHAMEDTSDDQYTSSIDLAQTCTYCPRMALLIFHVVRSFNTKTARLGTPRFWVAR